MQKKSVPPGEKIKSKESTISSSAFLSNFIKKTLGASIVKSLYGQPYFYVVIMLRALN